MEIVKRNDSRGKAVVYVGKFASYGRINGVYRMQLKCPYNFTDRIINLWTSEKKPLVRNLFLLNILGSLYSLFMILSYFLLVGFCILLVNPISEIVEGFKNIRYTGYETSSRVIWFLLGIYGVIRLFV